MTFRRVEGQDRSQPRDPMDAELTAALEAAPQIAIADDFAARVVNRLPARRTWTHSLPARASIGRRVAVAAAAVLAIVILGLAAPSHDANQLTRTVAEWTFVAEFVGLTLWLAMRPGTQN